MPPSGVRMKADSPRRHAVHGGAWIAPFHQRRPGAPAAPRMPKSGPRAPCRTPGDPPAQCTWAWLQGHPCGFPVLSWPTLSDAGALYSAHSQLQPRACRSPDLPASPTPPVPSGLWPSHDGPSFFCSHSPVLTASLNHLLHEASPVRTPALSSGRDSLTDSSAVLHVSRYPLVLLNCTHLIIVLPCTDFCQGLRVAVHSFTTANPLVLLPLKVFKDIF